METKNNVKSGSLTRVAVYLDSETFEELEKRRGLVKQSTFIQDIVKKSFGFV